MNYCKGHIDWYKHNKTNISRLKCTATLDLFCSYVRLRTHMAIEIIFKTLYSKIRIRVITINTFRQREFESSNFVNVGSQYSDKKIN